MDERTSPSYGVLCSVAPVTIVTGAARGLGRAYAKRLAGLGAKVAFADLSLHSYEEFEAEAKDMTADSTVAEIEATGGTLWGSRLMSATTRRSKRWSRGPSRRGVESMSWSRMQAVVVVGPWIPRPATSIRRSSNW
jgi:NAD(P)-dependent dehydrogenase (short-subunit alcohol dehydrogenase family)